jgi:hypothetical protein
MQQPYGQYVPYFVPYHAPQPPSTEDIENKLNADLVNPITIYPLPSGYAWEAWQSKAFQGFNIKFMIGFLDYNGHHWFIEVHAKWNKRSWFDDEPYALSLKLNGFSMANPTQGSHPALWSFLVHKAKRLIANHTALSVLHHYHATRVTLAVVNDLIATGNREALYALFTADTTPLAMWDQDAWSRVLDWQATRH